MFPQGFVAGFAWSHSKDLVGGNGLVWALECTGYLKVMFSRSQHRVGTKLWCWTMIHVINGCLCTFWALLMSDFLFKSISVNNSDAHSYPVAPLITHTTHCAWKYYVHMQIWTGVSVGFMLFQSGYLIILWSKTLCMGRYLTSKSSLHLTLVWN